MNIKTYLINLDDSTERLQTAKKQLEISQLKFERVSAFDGRNINPLEIDNYNDKLARNYMGRSLNGGEVGCFFSHLTCVKQFLKTDADYALVLEDDMTCPKDLSKIITELLFFLEKENMSHWYLINIGAHKNKISTPLKKFAEHTLYHSHYFSMTATGLIWSKQGAQAFLNQYQKHKIFCPVDNFLRNWLTNNNKGLSVFPPITSASGIESNIDQSHKKRTTTDRCFFYGLIKQKRLYSDKFKALKNKHLTRSKSFL